MVLMRSAARTILAKQKPAVVTSSPKMELSAPTTAKQSSRWEMSGRIQETIDSEDDEFSDIEGTEDAKSGPPVTSCDGQIACRVLLCAAVHAASSSEALLLAEAAHDADRNSPGAMAHLAWRLALFVPHTRDVQAHLALETQVIGLVRCAAAMLPRPLKLALSRLVALRLACAAAMSGGWELCADLAEGVLSASLMERDALVVAVAAHSALRRHHRSAELLAFGRAQFPGCTLLGILRLVADGHEEHSAEAGSSDPPLLLALLSSLESLLRYVLCGRGASGGADADQAAAAGHREPDWSNTQEVSWRLAGYLNILGRVALQRGFASVATAAVALLAELVDAPFAWKSAAATGVDMLSASWGLRGALALSNNANSEARGALLRAVALNGENDEALALLGIAELREVGLHVAQGVAAAEGAERQAARTPSSALVEQFPIPSTAQSPVFSTPKFVFGSPGVSRRNSSSLARPQFSDVAVGATSAQAIGFFRSPPGAGSGSSPTIFDTPSQTRAEYEKPDNAASCATNAKLMTAVFFAQRALRCNRRSVLAYQCIGEAAYRLGDMGLAAEALQEATRLESQAPGLPTWLLLPLVVAR